MSSPAVDALNGFGAHWWFWAQRSATETAFLAIGLSLFWFCARRRVQPQTGYWLWMLIPLKLALPITLVVPLAVAQWSPSHWIASLRTEVTTPAANNVVKDARVVRQRPPETSVVETTQNMPTSPEETPSVFESQAPAAPVEVGPGRTSISDSRPTPAISMVAWAAMAWLSGVVALFVVAVYRNVRFSRGLSERGLRLAELPLDVTRLLAATRHGTLPPIYETSCVSSPSVWRIWRPCILLPIGFTRSVAPEQLQWALLHELAHIDRRDLVVMWFQRCVQIVHWFNPVLWVVNRWLEQQREYICDDWAETWSDRLAGARQPTAASEALLQTITFAHRQTGALDGAMSSLGSGSRRACQARLMRLLDEHRLRATRQSLRVTLLLGLLAVTVIPQLRAQQEVPTEDAGQASSRKNVEVHVVGPEGKRVSNASVDIRMYPEQQELALSRGTLTKKGRYGFLAKADEEGRIAFEYPERAKIAIYVKTPGYGPFMAEWDPLQTGVSVPAQFTAELDRAWSVGGVVVDESGRPVVGAKIRPSVYYKQRPKQRHALGIGSRLETDSEGRWRFDLAPESEDAVFVEINHEGFRPLRTSLSRSLHELKGDKQGGRVVLPAGLVIRGTVTDDNGNPIEDALVRTKFLNDIRQAKTDAEGRYEIGGCEPRNTRVVVSAKGKALDMQEVRVHEAMSRVDFQMKPGGHVRVRVVDADGKGIPKARIFFQQWRGRQIDYFEFDHIDSRANADGIWEWNEAPLEAFHADICPPTGMQLAKQRLMARDEEYVFQPPPPLVVIGRVTDAQSKEPIKRFQAIPGIQGSQGSHIDWVVDQALKSEKGSYRLEHLDHAYFAHLVRIDAPGYLPKTSRDIQANEGTVTIDFELERGRDVSTVVRDATGKLAKGADVVLGVAGSQISLRNGRIDSGSVYNALQRTTNAEGSFLFPPQLTAYQLVVVHESGYAHVQVDEPTQSVEPITLRPWARLRGTYRLGKQPVRDVVVTVTNDFIHSYGESVPNVFAHYEATTGDDGAFLIDRMTEGSAYIRREIVRMVNDGATEVASTPILFRAIEAGKEVTTSLGGSGTAIIGQLLPPKQAREVNWNFASVSVVAFQPSPPPIPYPEGVANDAEARQAWLKEWLGTPSGRAWSVADAAMRRRRREGLRFDATVHQDGRFRVDDVPAGTYELSATLTIQRQRTRVGPLTVEVGRESEPVSVGSLQLGR